MTMMANAFSFEIKVALLGNVSAGKTTLLNALLRDRFSEVSMKRTTAGVNFFCIYPKTGTKVSSSEELSDSSSSDGGSSSMEWAMVPDDPQDAESTLKEITSDNAELRQSDKVVEKMFEIELEEELVKMNKNTKLVFVDIPGINEAGASHKYKDYVAEKWDTFDCVLIVMDGRQGVNTEEQVNLLKFAKANLEKKKVPIIILFNKVDDPYDDEQAELIVEARREVEKIFEVPDRVTMLNELLVDGYWSADPDELFPVFIPLSAVNGFIFRCASMLSLDEFTKFDKALIDKLGRERIGRDQWRKMSPVERLKKAHRVVMDHEGYNAALQESNFDKFLLALSASIGGEYVQRALIEKQIQVSLDSVSPSGGIVSHLRSAYMKTKALSSTATASGDQSGSFGDASVKATFWRVYKECEASSFTKFDSSPCHVDLLVKTMQELIDYHHLAKDCGWEEEHDKIISHAKILVRRQFGTILREEAKSDPKFNAVANAEANREWNWSELSPHDWVGVIGSVTLLSFDRHFCQAFGREKLMMEPLLVELQTLSKDLLKDQVIQCPRSSCPGILDFNRRCGSCKVFARMPATLSQSCPCPWTNHCHGRLVYKGAYGNSSFGCSSCSNLFYSLDAGTIDSINLVCPTCHEGLDCNRWCCKCNVHCRLSGSLDSNECPLCARFLQDDIKSENGDQVVRHCPSCSKRFQEVELPSLRMEFKDGEFVCVDPNFYSSVVRLDVPESPSDSKHYGHLAWKYCQLMASIEQK